MIYINVHFGIELRFSFNTSTFIANTLLVMNIWYKEHQCKFVKNNYYSRAGRGAVTEIICIWEHEFSIYCTVLYRTVLYCTVL